ncbi:hypothetical protein JKY72_05820 [Candidatus Gracilibacteria bacterium]|nr:hypothetical protein [Candidatus Gracilibacteria bacterium]
MEHADWQGSGGESQIDGAVYMGKFEKGGVGAPQTQKLMAHRYKQWAMETGVEQGGKDLRALFGSIDTTSLASGIDGMDILSEEVRELAFELEAFVQGHDISTMHQDQVTNKEIGDWTKLFVEEFNERFEGRANLRYTKGQGYFARLAKVQIPGSEKKGNFTFAILPAGCRAPDHTHNGFEDFAGEYTTTVFGELVYEGYDNTQGNASMIHAKGALMRKSADRSVDKYLEQGITWGGFFFQPVNGELI